MEDALPLARSRGLVMQVMRDEESPAEFVIIGDGEIIVARVRRVAPFRRTPRELEQENHELIHQLQRIPERVVVSREFWIYSKKNTWRYFQIGNAGLTETGRNGFPLAGKKTLPPRAGKGDLLPPRR
jgi:hypothetical protein